MPHPSHTLLGCIDADALLYTAIPSNHSGVSLLLTHRKPNHSTITLSLSRLSAHAFFRSSPPWLPSTPSLPCTDDSSTTSPPSSSGPVESAQVSPCSRRPFPSSRFVSFFLSSLVWRGNADVLCGVTEGYLEARPCHQRLLRGYVSFLSSSILRGR